MSEKPRPLGLSSVRRIALAIANVTEGTSYGTPAFRLKKTLIARMLDATTMVVKADFDVRELLVQARPDAYSVTPHYENYPWVVIDLTTVGHAELVDRFSEAVRFCDRGPQR
jgi:hypothetical protein